MPAADAEVEAANCHTHTLVDLDDEVVRSHTLVAVAVAVAVGELGRNRCSFVAGGLLLVVAVAFEYIQEVGYYMHKAAAAAAAAACCCRIAWVVAAVLPSHSCCCQ